MTKRVGPQFYGTKAAVDARHAAVLATMASQPDRAWSDEDVASALRHAYTRHEVGLSIARLQQDNRVEVAERGKRGHTGSTYRVKTQQEGGA
jgi:hypothetical protein